MPAPVLPAGLPAQFEAGVPGRTLIMDGDLPAYACAATTKTVPTAIRHMQMKILEAAFLAKAEDVSVHLTAAGGFKAGRHLLKGVKPYQGNRKGKEKPPNLEALREAMAREENWLPEFTVTLHREIEADDGMMIQAHQLKDSGVIRSEDKDLRLTPYPYYCLDRGEVLAGAGFGYTDLAYTPSGIAKGTGQGRKFFWLQMLMGDSADNVQGILRLAGRLCGPVNAVAYLQGIHDENETAEAVLWAYRGINQNPLPEAAMLWLLRHPFESVCHYLQGLKLSPQAQDFLMDCYHRDWYTPASADPDDPADRDTA